MFSHRLKTIFLMGLIYCHPAMAENYALVIGNNDYSQTKLSSLSNPIKDANLIAETLSQIGFTVTKKENLSKRDFDDLLDQFAGKLTADDIVFIYYAGHGVAYDNVDYLLPTFPNISYPQAFQYDAINAQKFLDIVSERSKHTIMVLDACRNTPYTKSTHTKGLGNIQSSKGSYYLFYAADNGQEAYDNRVFAQTLAKELLKPKSLDDISKVVRATVVKKTGEKQYPSVKDHLSETIYLVAPPMKPVPLVNSHANLKTDQAEFNLLLNRIKNQSFPDNKPLPKFSEMNLSELPEYYRNITCQTKEGYDKLLNFNFDLNNLKNVNKKHPCLITYILRSESIDDSQRQYWFSTLPVMKEEQIERLNNILHEEYARLSALDDNFSVDVASLNLKHLIEWILQDNERKPSHLQDTYSALRKIPNNYFRQYFLGDIFNHTNQILVAYAPQAASTKDGLEFYSSIISYLNNLNNKYHLGLNSYLVNLYQLELFLAKKAFNNQVITKEDLEGPYLGITWHLLTHNKNDLQRAVQLAREYLTLNPNAILINSNYAHALALLGEDKKAEQIYLKYQGKTLNNGRTWNGAMLEDFADLEDKGIYSPTFDKVKKQLR